MHCEKTRARRRAKRDSAATSKPRSGSRSFYPSASSASTPYLTLPVVSRRVLNFEAINKLAGHRFHSRFARPRLDQD